jgi:hypothetical protein
LSVLKYKKKNYPFYIFKLKILTTYDETFVIINAPNILMRKKCRDFRRSEEESEMKNVKNYWALRVVGLCFFDSRGPVNT